MAKKRIKGGARLRDVAAAAGVSKTTASLVLNGKAEKYGICPATRARVEAALRQTGYVPSQAALDMSAGRNSLVGLAVGGDRAMTDWLIASMEPALALAGLRLLVVVLPADPQAAVARLTGLDRFGVAALAVCPAGDLAIPKLSCPVVMLGRPGAGLPAVYEDEAEGGRQLALRLLNQGHRVLVVIGAASPVVNGFLESCAQSGGRVRMVPTVTDFLAAPQEATAVFCATPAALLEFYTRCPGKGIRPGADLAVVGADALGMAVSLVPRPTVLHPGLARIGQVAAQVIQQVIQGTAPGEIRLAPVITPGETESKPVVEVAPRPQTPEPVTAPEDQQPITDNNTPISQSKPVQMPVQAPAEAPAAPQPTPVVPRVEPVRSVVNPLPVMPPVAPPSAPEPVPVPVVTPPPPAVVSEPVPVPVVVPEVVPVAEVPASTVVVREPTPYRQETPHPDPLPQGEREVVVAPVVAEPVPEPAVVPVVEPEPVPSTPVIPDIPPPPAAVEPEPVPVTPVVPETPPPAAVVVPEPVPVVTSPPAVAEPVVESPAPEPVAPILVTPDEPPPAPVTPAAPVVPEQATEPEPLPEPAPVAPAVEPTVVPVPVTVVAPEPEKVLDPGVIPGSETIATPATGVEPETPSTDAPQEPVPSEEKQENINAN